MHIIYPEKGEKGAAFLILACPLKAGLDIDKSIP
jgi:hypothetical protein